MNRDEIIRMAREAGADEKHRVYYMLAEELERFAAIVAAHEREECAEWADLVAREIDNTNNTATYIASGIRARGTNEVRNS